MNIKKLAAGISVILFLHGCAQLDPSTNAIFVTKTSIGLDVDGTPPEASFAYGRTEGFLGPRYENGEVPPVASYLTTDGGIFDRNIKQFYATGRAAEWVSGGIPSQQQHGARGEKKAMFFGTSTTFGVKISLATGGVEGFTLGYRRKELSFIPIGNDGNKDNYASVIGVFTTDTVASTIQGGANTVASTSEGSTGTKATAASGSQIKLAQYFATGTAAEQIAQWNETQQAFRNNGSDAFGQYRDSVADQNRETVQIFRCFAKVDDSKFLDVLNNANELDLFQDDEAYDLIKAESNVREARAKYTNEIGISIGTSMDRSIRLKSHKTHVCNLAKNI